MTCKTFSLSAGGRRGTGEVGWKEEVDAIMPEEITEKRRNLKRKGSVVTQVRLRQKKLKLWRTKGREGLIDLLEMV